MANTYSVPTHELTLNGAVFCAGDSSLRIVFLNLNGTNFAKPVPWRTQTHGEYLAMMEDQFQVKFTAGVRLEFRKTGESVALADFQF